jgi:hypothetical protein
MRLIAIVITGHEARLGHIVLAHELLRYKERGFGFRFWRVGMMARFGRFWIRCRILLTTVDAAWL